MKRYDVVFPTLIFALVVRVGALTADIYAQAPADTSTIWYIETFDGNEYFGGLLERTSAIVRIDTRTLGTLTIPVESIKKIQPISAGRIKNGQLWMDNPQATRYFWAPNGFGLQSGEGYYQNVWVFFNHMAVGITENVSLGAGFVPAFLFGGAPTPAWVTPKVSFPVGGKDSNLHLGAGALVGTILGERSGTYGITYGVATLGTRDSNLNLGVGYGFAEGGWANKPTLTLSAMLRTGKRGYLITENYLIPSENGSLGLLSLGGRLVGKNMSFDYGLVVPVEDGQIYYALPWLGIAVPMGR